MSTSHNQGTVAALPPAEDAAPEAQSNVLGVFELYSIDLTFNVKLRTILRPIMFYRKYMIYNSEVPGSILSQIVNVQLNIAYFGKMADLTYFWDKSDLLIVSYLWAFKKNGGTTVTSQWPFQILSKNRALGRVTNYFYWS